ncbi:MAG TPA: GNAT family N-acetyltransferase [Ktedonobacterales bacterium]|jgi:predicted GNAT family acetyltransferase
MGVTYTDSLDGVDWDALRATLIADDFHNGRTPEQLRASFARSAGVCLARDGDRVIGTARVLSDGVCNAYVVDVWTHSDYRGHGVGSAMMRQLLEPLQGQHVYLFTDDAEEFYLKLGFTPRGVGLETVVGKWLVNVSPGGAA